MFHLGALPIELSLAKHLRYHQWLLHLSIWLNPASWSNHPLFVSIASEGAP
jgi:hypothetical protein